MAMRRGRSASPAWCFSLGVLLAVGPGGCADSSSGRSRGSTATDQPLLVSGEATCGECAIELDTLAVLGDPSDPASVRPDAVAGGCKVGMPEEGRFIVSGMVGGGQLLEYGADGRMEKSIGRRGAGPGEFGVDLVLIAHPDTLFVLDISLGRMAVTDRSGHFLSTFPLPVRVHSVAILASGDFLLHGRPVTSDDTGPLFRILDAQGTQVAAFGSPSPELGEMDQWVVSARSGGGFLAASMWEYVIYRGTSSGDLVPYIARRAKWFPSGTTWSEEILVSEPPPPLVTELREDASGLVWVFITVADEDCRLASPMIFPPSGFAIPSIRS